MRGSPGEHTGCREEASDKQERNGVANRHWRGQPASPLGRILLPGFGQAAQHPAYSIAGGDRDNSAKLESNTGPLQCYMLLAMKQHGDTTLLQVWAGMTHSKYRHPQA